MKNGGKNKSVAFIILKKCISKSETFIYSRFMTCKVKHFKSCLFLFYFDD